MSNIKRIQMIHRFCIFSLILIMGVVMTDFISAQDAGYRLPPQEVIDIIDAAPEPAVSMSPDAKWMLLLERDAMPDISDVSRRMLQLAGMRLDPISNGPFQTSFFRGIGLRPVDSDPNQTVAKVQIPLDQIADQTNSTAVKIAAVAWSHNSVDFAFSVVTSDGQQLWRAKISDSGQPSDPVLVTDRLNTVMGGFQWLPDGKSILCRLVPQNRGQEPAENRVPSGPNIQESYGNKTPTRTYQDLLKNPHDEDLFEYYAMAQMVVFDGSGSAKKVGAPGIHASFEASPDGNYLLVTRIQKPFSYLMTYRSFPREIEVWDLNEGQECLAYTVASVPMDENIPIEGVRTGPRNVDWKSGVAATLVWAEALDGGDPNVKADFRDRLVSIDAPFDSGTQELVKTEYRSYGVSYFEDPTLFVTTEYDRDRRWIRSLLHDTKTPGQTPKTLTDRSIRDRYGDPGSIVSVPDETGHVVARQDGDWIYRTGSGASPKGNLPFVDRQNLKTLETERLWRCGEGTFESVVRIVKSDPESKPVVITNRQSKTDPPNYLWRDLASDQVQPITDFQDPTPQIRGIRKQLVKYEREDGVPLSATLYLPADYQQGEKLPLLVWAYPREFNDAKTAAQISGSPHMFTRMRSITHLTLLTQGYAIMDAATMPVIGDPETMNDTFIQQIVDSAEAAIDKAVEMGVADRDRVAVGGHSYGAFMTANLMAHSDVFKAGVARSGAYNRTLTPFGFQSERRPYWEAKGIYHKISPFLHADKINEPLLLIHGENDNNSGTFPIQSKRMYQAIKGNGGIVRLCMLPFESHGYRARQSVLHTQAEMIAWLNQYVRDVSLDPADADEAIGSQ
ncbi:MAG: prolyl oligopeptidase family serine peptidase [Planctomycetota bacterium]